MGRVRRMGGAAVTWWGLIVEQNSGSGSDLTWSVDILGHTSGTREDALAALQAKAERYVPKHPHKARRRALYRQSDGFLLVLDGRYRQYLCRFTVAEQLAVEAPDGTGK
ncbi:hypothetical protein [Streptomyces sp. NPDC060031]|uniref:hypothetical protein n=1 Tax=Streptomyces sp. NPDC060031 TaxID=3347043 RepID=UPI0036832293